MRIPSVILALTIPALAQMPVDPLRSVTDPGVVTTRQHISPAGVQSIFSGKVQGVAFGAKPSELWVLNGNTVFHMDWRENRVLHKIQRAGTSGLQGLQFDAATQRLLTSGMNAKTVELGSIDADGRYSVISTTSGRYVAGSLAYSSKSRLAVVALTGSHQAEIIDVPAQTTVLRLDTGMVPFGAVMDKDGLTAYISNWGGKRPAAKDLTGRVGLRGDGDQIVVDGRGIASTGTVTHLDLSTGHVLNEITTGLHPTAMVADYPHNKLYVANGNQDTVSVIDTTTDKVTRTITIEPFHEHLGGIAPTALAIAADGATLYVACGGINAVAVISTTSSKLLGLIPTAWYPSGLALSPDGKYLAVSTLLGPGSGFQGESKRRFVHAVRGSVAVIPIPGAAELGAFTAAVAQNNHMQTGPATTAKVVKASTPLAVPVNPGDPSPIDHVVFIIKENRTYDQILGDIKKGNSDPSLLMWGRDVTPNQHKLAEQFVLLDNFYAVGGNSADGHQWVTQANETDYCLWPAYNTRSYPFDGTDPVAYSNTGFLWDAAIKKNKTVRIYGEYAGTNLNHGPMNRFQLLDAWKAGQDFTGMWKTVAPIEPLNKIIAANYPGYSTTIPDVARAQIFLADLKKWVASGQMPNLIMMALPSNHTNGTDPNSNTASAMVADNDLAVGQIVEGLSHSPFWKSMAILIVEDDAQGGVDHVDGHRTTAFVASPYAKRGAVDSTFYSHPSMLKTIELMLGMPPLTIFDRIASDMRASFQDTPDLTPFTAETPKQSIFEKNRQTAELRGQGKKDAIASAKMRWDVPDAAPSDALNRILWRSVKGTNSPYPKTPQSVFSPYSLDVADNEREGKR